MAVCICTAVHDYALCCGARAVVGSVTHATRTALDPARWGVIDLRHQVETNLGDSRDVDAIALYPRPPHLRAMPSARIPGVDPPRT